jgi:hypothetical protein
LTSTDRLEVFICHGEEEHAVHVIALDHPVVGVRNTPELVLALDAQGNLYGLDPRTGARAWVRPIGPDPRSLTALESGRWAVAHGEGITWGDVAQPGGEVPLGGAQYAAFDPTGQRLAYVTAAGDFGVVTPGQPPGPTQALGFASTGLAHSRLGYWLVSTTRGIFRVPTEGGEPELFLKWGGEHPPEGVVCSRNGRVCAFAVGTDCVALFGVEVDTNCGGIVYHDREVGELDFGPEAWLGIGIGRGDGNKIDLLHGSCHRTDPPPDRPRNRWMVQLGFEPDDVAQVYAPPAATPALPTVSWGPAREGEPPSFETIGTYVERRLLEPMQAVRTLSLLGFVLLAVVLGILVSVMISGAEGSDDIGVPVAISGFLFVVLAVSMVVRSSKVRDIKQLGRAIRAGDRGPIGHVQDVDVLGEGPGLELGVQGSRHRYCVTLDDASLHTLRSWLAA